MLRQHVISRSLGAMTEAAARRQESLASGDIGGYRAVIRAAVRGFYGALPVGSDAEPVQATEVSRFDKAGYRLENVLFDSFPGWQVNATVYVPLDFAPPFPAVVIPVGHSGKQFDNYQLPAQFFARCGYLAVLLRSAGSGEREAPRQRSLHRRRAPLPGGRDLQPVLCGRCAALHRLPGNPAGCRPEPRRSHDRRVGRGHHDDTGDAARRPHQPSPGLHAAWRPWPTSTSRSATPAAPKLTCGAATPRALMRLICCAPRRRHPCC